MNVPNDLDALLRDFYRAEMPDPWPDLKLPLAATPAPELPLSRSRSSARSRLVLAASVVVLGIGSWTLSSVFPEARLVSAESAPGKLEATKRGLNSRPNAPKAGEASWLSERDDSRLHRPRTAR